MSALVEVDDLRVWFPIKSGLVLDRHVGDIKAVDDVSLTIERGETLGLVGESGCGKSTIGRAIIRLYDPTAGRIEFDGRDITTLSETEMRPLRRRMQMVFQDPLGSIVEVSPAADLYENPLHPYTISLLSAVPIPDPAVERERRPILLQGDLPSPANPPHACRFHTRCPYVQPTRCRDDAPQLRRLGSGHEVACHWAEQIKAGTLQPHEREPVFEPGLADPVAEPPPV